MVGRAEQITRLRKKGRHADALALLWPVDANLIKCLPEHPDQRLAFQQHFLGCRTSQGDVPCLLLDAAAHGSAAEVLARAHALLGTFDDLGTTPWRSLLGCSDGSNPSDIELLLEARWRLLSSLARDFGQDELRDEWLACVTLVAKSLSDFDTVPSTDAKPAFLDRLSKPWSESFQKVEADWRELRDGGDQPDWDHPALLQVGEALAYIETKGEPLPTEGRPVETWVLLETTQAVGAHAPNDSYTDGLLARLVIEKVPCGGGLLYPDCRYNAYLPLGADFQQGLRNVMTVVRRRPEWTEKNGSEFDFRWRLTPLGPEDGHNLPALLAGVTGRSAEAAFACALLASLRGERLDQRVVVSACFADPDSPDDRLANVEGHRGKVLGLRDDPVGRAAGSPQLSTARPHFIDQIVLFSGDAKTKAAVDFQQPLLVHGWSIHYRPAGTLDDAYRLVSQQSRLTDRVKQHLAQRAKQLLEVTCTPHVRSSLLTRRPGDPAKQEPPEVLVRLKKKQVAAVLGGMLGAHRRTRVLAESGLGKSTLFIEAEYVIASQPGDRVPLRLGAGPASISKDDRGRWVRLPLLSDFDWTKPRDEVLADLGKRLLGDVLKDATERLAWLKAAVAHGDIVFLFDSLDQSEGKLDLAAFLAEDGVRDCPVLLSARPETRRTKSASYAGVDWHTLWVDPFDERRIRQFWGDAPLLDRLLENDDWKPLREVPVLLQQMKRLAVGGRLKNLPNREAVYYQTLELLVEHGHAGLEDAGHQQAAQIDAGGIEKLMAQIAWETIAREATASTESNGSFTGELSGDSYTEFAAAHRQQLAELDQLNLTTRQTYLDDDGRSREQFAWRHFSFCEWFAGLHLAGLPDTEQQRVIETHVRDPRWEWIFRFAVCAAARLRDQPRQSATEQQKCDGVVQHLTTALLGCGAAFLAWKIIDPGQDRIAVAEPLETLCRWLVHRDRDSWKQWDDPNTSPWAGKTAAERPVVTAAVAGILKTMFTLDEQTLLPLYRDSRWLNAAWQLVLDGCTSDDPNVLQSCANIRDSFLTEVERRVERIKVLLKTYQHQLSALSAADRGLVQLLPDETRCELGLLTDEQFESLRHWPGHDVGTYEQRRDTFNAGLKTHQANYCQCPPVGWEHPYPDERTGQPRPADECYVSGTGERKLHEIGTDALQPGETRYELQRTPVTNLQYEAFDPSHIRFRLMPWQRGAEDNLDDHPAVHVSWFMARMLCVWLTGKNQPFGRFNLPFDEDWEACCRAGRDRKGEDSGVPHGEPEKFDLPTGETANTWESGNQGTVPVGRYPANGFGLLDLHGQVWEWMQNEYERDNTEQEHVFISLSTLRSVRGGFWFYSARYARASYRDRYSPDFHDLDVGLRLSRTS